MIRQATQLSMEVVTQSLTNNNSLELPLMLVFHVYILDILSIP